MKYRKKPVVIEAIQWTGKNWTEVYNFTKDENGVSNTCGPHPQDDSGKERIQIVTLEGIMTADQGDWIIKGVKGEFYPCKPEIFQATYEPVAGEPVSRAEFLKLPMDQRREILASCCTDEMVKHYEALKEDV